MIVYVLLLTQLEGWQLLVVEQLMAHGSLCQMVRITVVRFGLMEHTILLGVQPPQGGKLLETT